MNTRCILRLFLAFLVGAAAPSSSARAQSPIRLGPMTFEHVLTLGTGASDVFFGWITDAAIDDDGTIYVVDGQATAVYAFDDAGAPLWTITARGEGPGDLESPGQIVAAGGRLYLENQGDTRIDVFRRDGRFERSIPATAAGAMQMWLAGELGDSLLVIGTTIDARMGLRVILLDPSSDRIVRERVVEREGESLGYGNYALVRAASSGASVAVGHGYTDMLSILGPDLETIAEIDESDGNFMSPSLRESGGRFAMWVPTGVRAPVALGDAYWLTDIRWVANVGSMDEYVASPDDAIERMRTIRLFDIGGDLVETVYDGPFDTSPFAAIYHADGDRLLVRLAEAPELAVFGRTSN